MPLPGFDLPEFPTRTEGDPRTRDRARTARQRRAVAQGLHPLRGDPSRPDLGTCGDCRHRVMRGGAAKPFPKCDRGPITNGPGTDVRAWWPACSRHEPKEPPK